MAKDKLEEVGREVWAMVVFEGVLAVLFGIAAVFWPGLTLALLVMLFAIFVLAWGVVDLIRGLVSMGKTKLWWLELAFGVLMVGLGVYLLRNPAVTMATFILFVGFTFIIRGGIDVISGLFGGNDVATETRPFRFISGALGLVAGVITLMQPVSAGIAIVWIIGLYAILQGAFVIALAVKSQSLLDAK